MKIRDEWVDAFVSASDCEADPEFVPLIRRGLEAVASMIAADVVEKCAGHSTGAHLPEGAPSAIGR